MQDVPYDEIRSKMHLTFPVICPGCNGVDFNVFMYRKEPHDFALLQCPICLAVMGSPRGEFGAYIQERTTNQS